MTRWLGLAIALVTALPGCSPSLACGAGTLERGGACVPDSMLTCGPGTREDMGECVVVTGGCLAGTVDRGGVCLPAHVVDVELPFEAGAAISVGQGMHGFYSHYGNSRHALDFDCALGTTVVAARDGVVVGLKEDSDTGCPDVSCADQGNFVRIDHGDGTYGNYFHLEQDGALVSLGDRVCAGEPIARSGNTGFSSGPHLHFQVEDAFAQSLPLWVRELGDEAGAIFAGVRATSENAPPSTCDHAIEPADCDDDLFAHDGVIELEGLPCALASRGVDYTVTGRVLGHVPRVYWASKADGASEWTEQCAEADADGRFEITVRFDDPAARAFVTIATALDTGDGSCANVDGWDASPSVFLR